jgi:hypothetical protein
MRYTIILAISILCFVPALAFSATLKVPSQYLTIQDAIDTASGGDTVLVAPGTYVENIDFKGKAITVTSEQGANVTVIDGNQAGSVVTFQNDEGSDSVLQGFTVTNGHSENGGGIYCKDSSPTIANDIIAWNAVNIAYGAAYGGGIYCDNSSPTITDNTITGNMAVCSGYSAGCGGGICCRSDSSPAIINNTLSENSANGGGGIYCEYSSPTITTNTISENTADGGGGICCEYSSPTISDNAITGNTVIDGGGGGIVCQNNSSTTITSNNITGNIAGGFIYGGFGGGLCSRDSSPTITNNIISNNSASFGGGAIYDLYSSLTITNNSIEGNTCDFSGGGIYCNNSSSIIMDNLVSTNAATKGGGIRCDYSFATITNNIISENSSTADGGGIYFYGYSSTLTITNNTVLRNTAYNGGGIYCEFSSSAIITNTLLWGDAATNGPEIWIGDSLSPSTLTISFSDVDGGQSSCHVDPGCTLNWGAGMIDSDPLFSDAVNDDFHLTFNSPCRGSGDNAAVLDLYDFEGDSRIAYGTVDMGADEFYTHLYYTGNATPGGSVEIKFVGLPGTAPVGLCIGTGVLDPPIPSMWGDWYLKFPIFGPYIMPSIPATGVLIIPGTIPVTPPAPYSLPMQALIGAELTNLTILEVK